MKRLILISLLLISQLPIAQLYAQTTFPTQNGERIRYSSYIEMNGAYISGICVLLNEDGVIQGCLFNEFGITAIEFSYNPERNKVKLKHVIKMMDKWYIRRVLRKDIAQLMSLLYNGKTGYQNTRRNISYQFIPIIDEVTK